MGGAVLNDGWNNGDENRTKTYISNSIFNNNSASNHGGAINSNRCNLTIFNSSFNHNNANISGAIHICYSSIVNLSNLSLTYNNANQGMAICILDNPKVNLTNSTIINNESTSSEIYVTGGKFIMNNNILINYNLLIDDFIYNNVSIQAQENKIYSNITASITDNNGYYIIDSLEKEVTIRNRTNGIITVIINGKEKHIPVTKDDENAIFTLTFTPENFSKNINDIIVTYENTIEFGTEVSTIRFQILKRPVNINVDTVYVARSNQTTTITAKLTADNDLIVDGGKLVFKLNGITLKNDNNKVIYAQVINGTAVISYDFTNTRIDNKTISAVYSGSGIYASARISNISISYQEDKDVSIVLDPITATRGSDITITAYIKDVYDNNLNAGKVIFKVNGKTIKDTNGKVIYAQVIDGVASAVYHIPDNFKIKNFSLTAVFMASGYNRQTCETTLSVIKE